MKRQPLRSAVEQEPIPEGRGRVRQQHASFSPSPFLFVEAVLGTVQEAVSWNWRLPSANTGHMKMSQKDNRRRMEVPMSSKFWRWMEIKSPLSTSLICLIKGMWLIPIHWGLARKLLGDGFWNHVCHWLQLPVCGQQLLYYPLISRMASL